MNEQFTQLKTVLNNELDIYDDLSTIAVQMNEAIKKNNIDKIQASTSRYDALTVQIEFLETKRLELCDAILKKLKPHHRHMNLLNIIALLPKEEQKTFIKTRESLKEKINHLSRINISNQILLNEAIKAIGSKFEIVSQYQNKLTGYKHTGNPDKNTIPKNIINQLG